MFSLLVRRIPPGQPGQARAPGHSFRSAGRIHSLAWVRCISCLPAVSSANHAGPPGVSLAYSVAVQMLTLYPVRTRLPRADISVSARRDPMRDTCPVPSRPACAGPMRRRRSMHARVLCTGLRNERVSAPAAPARSWPAPGAPSWGCWMWGKRCRPLSRGSMAGVSVHPGRSAIGYNRGSGAGEGKSTERGSSRRQRRRETEPLPGVRKGLPAHCPANRVASPGCHNAGHST